MPLRSVFARHWRGGFVFLLLSLLACAGAATAASANPQPAREGRLQVEVEDHPDRSSRTRYFLLQDGRRTELRNPRGALGLPSGSRVRVRDGASGAQVEWVGPSAASSLAGLDPGATATAQGVQNVAVLMVNFADDGSRPVTAAQLQATVFDTASEFLRENSGGRTWFAGSILGWYSLPMSRSSCDTVQLADLADQAAAAAGVDLSVYTRKFYVFPRNACAFDGLGVSGGAVTRAWFNGKFDAQLFAHEFGHNLGLAHSHGLNCEAGTLGVNCQAQDYGDVADTMGNGPGHFNAFQKERLGWIDGLGTVSASGRYALAPYALGAGVRALKIPRGPDAWYYLEFRQPQGFDAPLASVGNLTAGVLLRKGSTGPIDSVNSSFLLDATPDSILTPADLRDAALLPGRTYVDLAAGVSVSVLSADATGAVLDISLSGATTACTPQPPALSLGLTPSVLPGASTSIAVTVVNRDSADCAATSFDLAALVPSGWSGVLGSRTLQLSAGATGSSSLALTVPADAAEGDHSYSLRIACARGQACAAAASGVVRVAQPALSQTVATTKAIYRSGDLVGMGTQVLDRGVPVRGATVSFTLTGPSGQLVVLQAVTDGAGSAGVSYRLNKKKDPPGSYRLRAGAQWAGQAVSADTSFQVR